MNYKWHYEKLIKTRKGLNRKKKQGVYYEKHHIIPKSCGGTNEENNIVLLTPKEHYVAHLLLIKIYSGRERSNMVYALWKMAHGNKKLKNILSAKQYAYARDLFIKECSLRIVSQETKDKMSNSCKHKGGTRDAAIGRKISLKKTGNSGAKLKGRTYEDIYGAEKADEMKKIRRNSLKEKTYEEIYGEDAIKQKEKLQQSHLGEKHTKETIEKRTASLKLAWDEGRHSGMTGKKQSKETIEKRIKSIKENGRNKRTQTDIVV